MEGIIVWQDAVEFYRNKLVIKSGENGAEGFSKKMTGFLSRAEIYHQISVIYEKIMGKDFLIHIALQGA
jgi:hypothetical protein